MQVLFGDDSIAKKLSQRETMILQSVVPKSRWQSAITFEACQNSELNRMPSEVVLHRHRVRGRNFKLVSPDLFSFRERTRQPANCNQNLHSFFLCALSRDRSLDPYPLLVSRLYDGYHPLETLSAPAFARSRRRQPEVGARSFGRNTPFQASRVGWSHRKRASTLCFLQCHHFVLREEVSRHQTHETLTAAFRASHQ